MVAKKTTGATMAQKVSPNTAKYQIQDATMAAAIGASKLALCLAIASLLIGLAALIRTCL